MPTTRSSSNARKSSPAKVDAGSSESGEGSGSWLLGAGEPNDDLLSHLSALRRGIQNLKKSQEDLLRKNGRLQQEIDHLHNEADVSVQPSPVKSKGKNNPLLHMKVKELELEVRKLKKARALDRKKIKKLQQKEAHREAEELQDERLHGVPDVEHKMKKLLRQFYRVVSSPSLGEEEECPICADALELNKCSSLPCQHIFCDVCLSKLSGGEDINCPQCRRPSDMESLEQVEITATQQWDELLGLAQQFAAMEVLLGPDTSEEEEEENLRENFIDDCDTEASAPQEHDAISDATHEDGSVTGDIDIPYSESGVVEKRRRMQQLVARRTHKRLRSR